MIMKTYGITIFEVASLIILVLPIEPRLQGLALGITVGLAIVVRLK